MWIFTPIGFFSVVADRGGKGVWVRARFEGDLERLRDQVLPTMAAIAETPDADYRFRVLVPRRQWTAAARRLAERIDYDNFKTEVARHDPDRAHLYMGVWSHLRRAQEADRPPTAARP
jgi:hypothetical protein